MTLFNPILEGRESAYHRSSSMETIFIKAHGLLFTGGSRREFVDCVQHLTSGLFDNYIGRVTAKFKEQGVFAALSNISSLFEYGILTAKGTSRSTLRIAFDEMLSQRGATDSDPSLENLETPPLSEVTSVQTDQMTKREQEASISMIRSACDITFKTLSIALRRVGDKNVYPLVHVYLVFLYGLSKVEKGVSLLESRIPWTELATFLSSLAKTEAVTSKLLGEHFPRPDEGIGRPLPEDLLMRGQLWSQSFFPNTWFLDAAIDDEERTLELPSMTAPRIDRMLWLGHRVAACQKYLLYDGDSRTFAVSQHVKDLPLHQESILDQNFGAGNDQDSIMSGVDPEDDDLRGNPDNPDNPVLRPESYHDTTSSEAKFRPKSTNSKDYVQRPRKHQTNAPTKILTKQDAKTTEDSNVKRELTNSPLLKAHNADSEEWLKGEITAHKPGPRKTDLELFTPIIEN